MTSHDRYRELVAGYALSALEPEDEQLLRAHLPACAACSRELIESRESVAHLAYAADPVEPPASLFAAIRAQVLEETPGAFDAQDHGERSNVVELAPRRRRLETRAAKLVAVAASVSVAAVVGLGAWNISLQQENAQRGEISAAAEKVLDSIKAGNGQMVMLKDESGSVHAVAVMHGDVMELVTDGLAPNDTKVSSYVLWKQSNSDAPEAVARFDVDQAEVDVVPAVTLKGAAPERLLISQEPGRTGPLPSTPTGRVYAQGTLA